MEHREQPRGGEKRADELRAALSFGLKEQASLLPLSKKMAEQAGQKEMLQTEDILAELKYLLTEWNSQPASDKKRRLFRRSREKELRQFYKNIEETVDRLKKKLIRYRNFLHADTLMLGRITEENNDCQEKLQHVIQVGEKKLSEMLVQIQDASSAEGGRDSLRQTADVMKKRMEELSISLAVTRQNEAQLQLMEETNRLIMERIQEAVVTAVPLWRNAAVMDYTEPKLQSLPLWEQKTAELAVLMDEARHQRSLAEGNSAGEKGDE